MALWVLVLLFTAVPSQMKAKAIKPPDVDYYTCTMHPSVRSQDPDGKCPICGMNLVPVKKQGIQESTNSTSAETPGEFTVPVERQQQIGVTYATIEEQPFHFSLRTVGIVAYDKGRHWDYVARIEGYVSKLFVFSRGDLVEKDSPLMSIYSPDLLTTENEFVNLLKTQDEARAKNQTVMLESTGLLVEAAKQRLRLWNITDKEIANLESTRQPEETLTLYSPFKGVVQDLDVDQGRHVSVGDHLVDVADLSTVWIWVQFYQDELSLLKTGLPVTITTSSYPGEKFTGKISVIDPFINNEMRTARVRIDVENADFKLRPEMYVDVRIGRGHGRRRGRAGRSGAATGMHNIVFVDKGGGRLQPRFIELGRKYGDFFEVKSGLKEDERVVNSANFLIDAEAQVQGALKSW